MRKIIMTVYSFLIAIIGISIYSQMNRYLMMEGYKASICIYLKSCLGLWISVIIFFCIYILIYKVIAAIKGIHTTIKLISGEIVKDNAEIIYFLIRITLFMPLLFGFVLLKMAIGYLAVIAILIPIIYWILSLRKQIRKTK